MSNELRLSSRKGEHKVSDMIENLLGLTIQGRVVFLEWHTKPIQIL